MAKMAHRVAPISILAALLAAGCLEFRGVGPEDATPERPPRLVNVTVEYLQPAGCVNSDPGACNHPVVFFGSWMRPGSEFALTPDPDTWVYRGVAYNVPVNFPPHEYESPYQIRVWDPHLGTYTGYRIKFGSELLFKVERRSNDEYAWAFVDENGLGRNPFY
jgi:hypothetical protein